MCVCSSSRCYKAGTAIYTSSPSMIEGEWQGRKYQGLFVKLVYVYKFGITGLGIKAINERSMQMVGNTCGKSSCLNASHLAVRISNSTGYQVDFLKDRSDAHLRKTIADAENSDSALSGKRNNWLQDQDCVALYSLQEQRKLLQPLGKIKDLQGSRRVTIQRPKKRKLGSAGINGVFELSHEKLQQIQVDVDSTYSTAMSTSSTTLGYLIIFFPSSFSADLSILCESAAFTVTV